MTDLTLPLDYAAIERILPHRYPFLLVDRIALTSTFHLPQFSSFIDSGSTPIQTGGSRVPFTLRIS